MEAVSILQEDIFKAVARDNHFRGRQKVYDWYWAADDDICFCTTSSEEPTEHYSQRELGSAMSNFFGEIDPLSDKVTWHGGKFVFSKT